MGVPYDGRELPEYRPQPGIPMRVLVIEDDRETASFLQKALKESGHAADLAGDGETVSNWPAPAATTC